MMRKPELNDLVWFQAVAELRSFTKAAAKIGVAQSTLSHTIKQLEARMGVQLLTRNARDVAQTAAGERLLTTITPRLADIKDEIADLMAAREKPLGMIRMTLSDHALHSVDWPKLKSMLTPIPTSAWNSASTAASATSSRKASMQACDWARATRKT